MASSFSALRIRPRRLLTPTAVPVTMPLSRTTSTNSALHPASTICLAPFHPPLRRRRYRPGTIHRRFHPPSTTHCLLSPSLSTATTSASSPFRARTRDRRWASSIVVAEDEFESDGEDDVAEGLFEEDDGMIIEEEDLALEAATTATPPPPKSSPKKKMTKRQKRKQSLAGEVRFLQFRDETDSDEDTAIQELGNDFDQLAFNHDLSRFRWISALEKKLLLKLQRDRDEETKRLTQQQLPNSNEDNETEESSTRNKKKNQKTKKKKKKDNSTDRVREYWKVVLKAVNNKKQVHDDLREHFLTNMVAGATPDPSNNNNSSTNSSNSIDAPTVEDERDAMLLAKSRDLAVDHPLLWRRFSARERKLKVNRSKKLVQKRAAKLLEDENCDDYREAAVLAAVDDKSTSLDFYLNHVRIPALRTVHFGNKPPDQRAAEAVALQQRLKKVLPEESYAKIMALVKTYADCFGEQQHEENTATWDSNAERTKQTQEQQTERQKRQKQFRVLLSNLRKTLPQGRIHWIGKDVADFFYVTAPDEVDRTEKNDEFSSNNIENDSVLGHSASNWENTKDKYVHSFRNIRRLFTELEKEQTERKQLLEEGDASAGIFDDEDDDEDPSSEKSILRTFDMVTALSKLDAKQFSTQRVKPRKYIPLEAMGMGDSWKDSMTTTSQNDFLETLVADHQRLLGESSSNDHQQLFGDTSSNDHQQLFAGAVTVVFDSNLLPHHPPTDRLVIIDNLPIDISQYRLREAYGRCGDIDAIQIFHARPDLDPGRRATDSKKKIRNASSSSRRQKWSRPRTPLYAMILFRDATAATKATCDPLRIFGMVLDHHLVRSHRACDSKTLYLEDVPSSAFGGNHQMSGVAAMEFELNKTLETSDLYVYLDESGLQQTGRRKNELLSYAIRFPSFEAAYWSYQKLSLEMPFLGGTKDNANANAKYHLQSPALHWMETPRDSYLYWTRKLNF